MEFFGCPAQISSYNKQLPQVSKESDISELKKFSFLLIFEKSFDRTDKNLSSLNKVLNDYHPSKEVNDWTDMIKAKKLELLPRVTYDDVPLKPQTVIKEIAEAEPFDLQMICPVND